MSLAALSLAALVVALAVSCVSPINIGVLAIVLAWVVGVYFGGMRIEQVLAGFPISLFLTLVGVTLLFAQAQGNGTLQLMAERAVRLCRGKPGVIPVMFFVLTAALSSSGPGNIAATALMAPLGMAAAVRYGISPFLMAIMIANGASAGSVSPIAPTGVIVNQLVEKMGLPDARLAIYANNFLAHAAVAVAGYLLLGGWRLLSAGSAARKPAYGPRDSAARKPAYEPRDSAARKPAYEPRDSAARKPAYDSRRAGSVENGPAGGSVEDGPAQNLDWRHRLTLAVIAALILGAIAFNLNVGMAAFAGALVLTLSRAANETAAFKAMPWNVIVMVTGVTVLVALLEKTGGMDLFTTFLGNVATPTSVIAVTAFFTALVSIYSSTTAVVLPAMLPIVPGLLEHIGSDQAMAVISAMVVGGHLVDVSPLSTLGALCIAAAPAGTDSRRLFNQLLAWGLSMTVVAALVCWILFGVLDR
jgi:di/tricarboxylate transporter